MCNTENIQYDSVVEYYNEERANFNAVLYFCNTYVDKTKKNIYKDKLLDVIFISNGEVNADYNFEKLKFYGINR